MRTGRSGVVPGGQGKASRDLTAFTLGEQETTRRCLLVDRSGPSLGSVMLLMFVVWLVVFIGIFRRWRWTPLLVLANLAYTLLVLRIHMTDPIPLNF
jgi:hypothetical protein